MPRIAVSNDDRRPTQVEHLAAADLDSEQFRRRLIERLRRALRDAAPQTNSALAATSSRRRDRDPQAMVTAVRAAARRLAEPPYLTYRH
jgi:hypothetical protein